MLLCISALFFPLVLADSQIRLFHRVLDPKAEEPSPFIERGLLTLSSIDHAVALEQSLSLAQDVLAFPKTHDAIYQLALEREGDLHQGQWDISSVKACHLPTSSSETIVLHVADSGKPFALDYFLAPIPHDGSCPKRRLAKSNVPVDQYPVFGNQNITILVRSPNLPPLPELRVPPPLTAEGALVQPVPEKSFIQKYWIYMLVVLGALLLGGGPEEEQSKRAAA